MKRRPTTQDITWLLDLARNNQLDLDPPYQRRSVWTKRDKQFFLDTIFRSYPSPAIFLHKSVSDDGQVTYHVVDGKQRLQTILDFVNDDLRVAKEFGDSHLNGKKWSDLKGDAKRKHIFWNYQVSVEMVDSVDGSLINEVFDRLNRNSRKLTRQELRHAKFEGWLIRQVETEAKHEDWETLGVVTTARVKRMADAQFISELMLVVLEKSVLGFDQDALDEFYGKYDDAPEDSEVNFSEEKVMKAFASTRSYLVKLEEKYGVVSEFAKSYMHFYTLWCVVVLHLSQLKADSIAEVAERYTSFMRKVEELGAEKNLDAFLRTDKKGNYKAAFSYFSNTRGASTDLAPRLERYNVLSGELVSDE